MSNTTSPSPEPPADPGRVTDWRTTPAGVMPRHLQQWVLLGIAVVMVGIMTLSGSPTKPRATAAPSPAASAVDAESATDRGVSAPHSGTDATPGGGAGPAAAHEGRRGADVRRTPPSSPARRRARAPPPTARSHRAADADARPMRTAPARNTRALPTTSPSRDRVPHRRRRAVRGGRCPAATTAPRQPRRSPSSTSPPPVAASPTPVAPPSAPAPV